MGVDKYVAILTSLAFVLAGAFRLARFNTMPSNRNAFFKGMPIPMASVLLITASFWQHWEINIWWTIAVITVSYLMVSPFPYPKSKHVFNLPIIVWPGMAGLVLIIWLLIGWQAMPFALMLLYALSGPILSVHAGARQALSQVS